MRKISIIEPAPEDVPIFDPAEKVLKKLTFSTGSFGNLKKRRSQICRHADHS
jgi:hypothetical protein